MALKTLVKVGNISNLSDARYCAGMGVDMLGFTAIQEQPHYIDPKLYQDIRGWVAGPSSVIELYGLKSTDVFESILENYRPDLLEVGTSELQFLPESLQLQLVVKIESKGDLQSIITIKERIKNVIISELHSDLIEAASKHFSVLISLQSINGLQLLDKSEVKGVVLYGTQEIRPGYKDYGDLADVLEQLEVE